MNPLLILILTIAATSSQASTALVSINQCRKLFQEPGKTATIVPKIQSLPAVISETTYGMITAAMKRNIEQGFQNPGILSSGPVQQMLKIGVPREEIVAHTREGLQNELQEMAKVTTTHFELTVKEAPRVSMVENVLNSKISMDEFIEYYNLNGEVAAVTKILDYKDASRSERANPIEILKIAILTGQKDLAREAFVQSFRFNKIADLVKVGIETGNNEVLMNIGRILIVKFLKFDRNTNYLRSGLDALLEVKGPEKKQAEALLLDFVDILKSEEIFRNEDSVANFGVRGDKEQYLEEALKALISASTLTGRISRDSVSHHRFVETRDPRILSRIREVVKKGQVESSSLGLEGSYEAVAILKDPAFAESIANYHLKVRFIPQENAPEFIKVRLPSLHTKRALKFALLSGNIQFVKGVIKEILENDPMDKPNGMRDGLHLYSKDTIILKSVVTPSHLVRLFGEMAKDKSLTPGQYDFLSNTRKNLIKDFQDAAKNKPNLNSNLFIREDMDLFSHHKEVIESSLGSRSGFKSEDGIWSEFIVASNERDVQKLKVVYNKMMTSGRGLDAVYVAFTIAVIENGGDMNTFKALESGGSALQIEKKP